MTSYILVRKSRDGRQSITDEIHCIEEDSNKTACESLSREKLRSIRTLSVFTGDAKICDTCSDKLNEL